MKKWQYKTIEWISISILTLIAIYFVNNPHAMAYRVGIILGATFFYLFVRAFLDKKMDEGYGYIKVPKEMKDDLENLAKEYFDQDNRGTAMPIYFQVRERVEGPAYTECGESIYVNGEGIEIRTAEEAIKYLKDEDHTEDEESFDMFEIDTLIDVINTDYDEDFREVFVEEVDRFSNTFLTAKACIKYINLNRHNLAPDTISYSKHAHRNPEMELIKNFLNELNEVKE